MIWLAHHEAIEGGRALGLGRYLLPQLDGQDDGRVMGFDGDADVAPLFTALRKIAGTAQDYESNVPIGFIEFQFSWAKLWPGI